MTDVIGVVVILVIAFVLVNLLIYGGGEACCWPVKDPYKWLRYIEYDEDYVHSEDVPYEWQTTYGPETGRGIRKLFRFHKQGI